MTSTAGTTRTLCLWCPDWPVVALRRAGRAPHDAPVVVMGEGPGQGGRVRAASAEARAEGVRRGMRRREAEARCPGAVVVGADLGIEARVFEDVARSLDAVTPRLALERPGLLSFPTRGPARYFKSEIAVAQRALAAASNAAASPDADAGVEPADIRIGIAGSRLAALLAARRTSPDTPLAVLDEEETAVFLASRPVSVLRDHGLTDLAGLLRRLGIRTLGDLAALPEASAAARFGAEGALALRLARGGDDGVAALAAPPPDMTETAELDPPAQRVDIAAFAARALAERLLERLARQGLGLTRVTVEAETEHGERLARVWRFSGPFTEAALAQRVRWQLEAWVAPATDREHTGGQQRAGRRATSGALTLLRLVPDEVVPARGHQLDFWGADARAGERAARVLARLQGMLGHEAVVHPVVTGGRTPEERTGHLPFGDPLPARNPEAPAIATAGGAPGGNEPPWPGSVPPPSPALVCSPPFPAMLVDAAGSPVRVSGRGELSSPPAHLTVGAAGRATTAGSTRDRPRIDAGIEQWAGPWTQDVRPWDPATRHRRALFQVVAGGVACLVALEEGRAGVIAVYD